MERAISGILIAGTSHVGKSIFAARLTKALGWGLISTDSLARHPGRPWPTVRPAVAEFYSSLSPETIHWFLKVHHENIWSLIREKIEAHIHDGRQFICEGSALRPEYLATLNTASTECVCLYADDDFLLSRMRSEAGYDHVDSSLRYIIDKFIERSLRDNSELKASALSNQIRLVNAADMMELNQFYEQLLQQASNNSEK